MHSGSFGGVERVAGRGWGLRGAWGSWGGYVSKKSCAARCSRGSVQGVLRAPAEGEGGVAHREDLAATASATLERSTGMVAHGKRAARERRRRRSKVSRRPRAAGAPWDRWEARARAARVQTAGEDLWWVVVVVVVVVVRTPTPNYLRQASPDRGKYIVLNIAPKAACAPSWQHMQHLRRKSPQRT